MIYISHRGNIDGKKPHLENSQSYIDEAIELGYDVEVDLWHVDGNFFLGYECIKSTKGPPHPINSCNSVSFILFFSFLYNSVLNSLETNFVQTFKSISNNLETVSIFPCSTYFSYILGKASKVLFLPIIT